MDTFTFRVYHDGGSDDCRVDGWTEDEAVEAAKDWAWETLDSAPTAIVTMSGETLWKAHGID